MPVSAVEIVARVRIDLGERQACHFVDMSQRLIYPACYPLGAARRGCNGGAQQAAAAVRLSIAIAHQLGMPLTDVQRMGLLAARLRTWADEVSA